MLSAQIRFSLVLFIHKRLSTLLGTYYLSEIVELFINDIEK